LVGLPCSLTVVNSPTFLQDPVYRQKTNPGSSEQKDKNVVHNTAQNSIDDLTCYPQNYHY